MPEWSNGAVSKTVVLLGGTGGSNPFLSAIQKKSPCESVGIFSVLQVLPTGKTNEVSNP